jgi:DNA-binding MarR family transcriptional regulator
VADASSPDIEEIASSLQVSVGLLRRRLRQMPQNDGGLSVPEITALARLRRSGPCTVTELARLEGISPQSMGATLSKLDARGLIERRPDASDGRRVFISLSKAGRKLLRSRHDERQRYFVRAISQNFNARELKQLKTAAELLERLAGNLAE